MPKLAVHKPDLKTDILNALKAAYSRIYPESMQSLVHRDITEAIRLVNK